MTFEGEAISIAAAHATLTEIVERDVVGALYKKGQHARHIYSDAAKRYQLHTSLIGYEPCMHMEFEAHDGVSSREILWLMNQELARNGIFTLGAFILCFSHNHSDLRKLTKALDRSMAVCRQAVDCRSTEGFLNKATRERINDIKVPAHWRQERITIPVDVAANDRQRESRYLSACAENIQWLLDDARVHENCLTIEGWAIPSGGSATECLFLLNGEPFPEVSYPLASPHVGEFFWNIPAAQAARFVCKTTVHMGSSFPDGFARLEFLPPEGPPEKARRLAWYLPQPNSALPVPTPASVQRVISVPNQLNYLIGGASIYKRLESYLSETFDRTFEDFPAVLDWGCGCGRVARYFQRQNGTRFFGVDVDHENVAWCGRNLGHGHFVTVSLLPPLPFPQESFDLILGIAVLSQLSEKNQILWLQELQRVAKPNALVMISIQGPAQIALNRPPPKLLCEIDEKDFVATGHNGDLDQVILDPDYYVSVVQSRKYIRSVWSGYFSVVDIVDALAANQDLVVMKNDNR
jgi:SAM-dependent methyltransferase